MAKAIKGDELLCTVCGATSMGPTTKCECPGGRSKPSSDYCQKQQLLDAAKARGAVENAKFKADNVRKQGEVQAARTKKKEGGGADIDAEVQGDGVEIQVKVDFPIGKLGMALEKNCVTKVTGDPAQECGVHKGWVLVSVDGTLVPASKSGVEKVVMSVFKEKMAGLVTFIFRTPITDGYSFCQSCDKFQEDNDFEAAQLEAGPGKQVCAGCEEFAGMF
eukprot:gene28245-31348_t